MTDYEVNLNSVASGFQTTSQDNEQVSLVVVTDGVQAISVIMESLNGSFSNQKAIIYISNDSLNWTNLKEIALGNTNSINYSFIQNADIFASPLHFRFVKFYVPALGDGLRGKIFVSVR